MTHSGRTAPVRAHRTLEYGSLTILAIHPRLHSNTQILNSSIAEDIPFVRILYSNGLDMEISTRTSRLLGLDGGIAI